MLKEKHFYQFDDFRVEPDERLAFRKGKRLGLSGKSFDVLVVLLKHHGRLVRRDQLILEVWPDTHVDGGNLHVQITNIRKVLKRDYIESVAGQGYRFNASVTEGNGDLQSASPWFRSASGILVAVGLLVLLTAASLYFTARSRQKPTLELGLYERALEYEKVGDDEQALAALEQTITREPNNESACIRAAFLAYELEQEEKATGYLERCKVAESSDEAIRLKAQGLAATLADDSARALETYQLLVDRHPNDTDSLYRLAELATDKDRLQDAERSLQHCLKLEPDNRYCTFQLMYVQIKENRYDDVLVEYKSLPASLRDYPWFDEPLGIAFYGKGQLGDAERAFARLAESAQRLHGTTHFTVAKEWQADLLLYQGQVNEGTRAIEQIIATDDNAQSRATWLAYLGKVHALTGDEKAAKKFASQVASLPADPTALFSAALVLADAHDSQDAERLLKIRFDATNTPLSPANDHLMRGVLLRSKGDAGGAIEEIRLAADLNPRDEEAAYQLGLTYFQAGSYEPALKMFDKVLELNGTVLFDNVPLMLPLSKYRIAQCYRHLGRVNAAEPFERDLATLWTHADDELRAKYLLH